MTANCRVDYDLPTIALPVQSSTEKIYFNFTDEIVACINIKPQNYVTATGTSTYRPKVRNLDMLNCPDALCVHKGVLEFPNVGATGASVTYQFPVRAEEFALGGVYTMVMHTPIKNQGNAVDVKITFGSDADFKNADVYEKREVIQSNVLGGTSVVTSTDIQTQIFVSSSDVPSEMIGTGWNKTGLAFVKVEMTPVQPTGEDPVPVVFDFISIGKIDVFDSITEFTKNDLGWLTCLDTLDFNPTIDATDPDCVRVSLDPTSADTAMTLNVKRWSANFLDASPLAELSDEEVVGLPTQIRGIVESDGTLYLPNFTTIECGFIGASSEDCNAQEGRMTYVSIPTVTNLSESQFQIVYDATTRRYFARFSEDYVGSEVTVIYPVEQPAKVYKISINGGKVKPVRILIHADVEGGYDYYYSINGFFNNIPLGLSTTENQTVEITFTPTPVNGYIGEIIEVHS